MTSWIPQRKLLCDFRQGGFLEHPEDYVEETVESTPKNVLLIWFGSNQP